MGQLGRTMNKPQISNGYPNAHDSHQPMDLSNMATTAVPWRQRRTTTTRQRGIGQGRGRGRSAPFQHRQSTRPTGLSCTTFYRRPEGQNERQRLQRQLDVVAGNCFSCHKLGHRSDTCPKRRSVPAVNNLQLQGKIRDLEERVAALGNGNGPVS